MRTVSYPSDLTGFQWSLIKPHLPVYPGGRPRKTDLRDVVDAIFYILRTGCQWRYLPKDFPPKSTVWRYFNQWRHNGTLETIHDLLRRKVRAAEKPYSPRTSASVDSQSVDTTSGGEQRGRDNAKNVDGRKRHIVVDSMGLLMAVLVTAASIDDAKAAAELFARLDGQPMSHVKRMYADSKYHNFILYEWVETNAAWELNIVQRPKDAVGWVLLPIRWTVERTFAWLGRCRRLSKDREKSVRSSEAFVKLAMIHLMLNRLAQKKRMPSSTIVRRHKPTCGTDTKCSGNVAVRTVVPTTLNRPSPHSMRYQDIGSPPKTRAKAQNGTPNLRRNSGPSTSAVCCHVGHQKGRADAVSRVVFQEDVPDWDLLLSRHAVVLQFVSEREVHREQLRGLTETIIKGAPKRLGIMDDPQIVLFLDRQTDGTVPSRRPCRDSFGHDPPPSVARGRRSWPFCLVMSASSCPPKSVTVSRFPGFFSDSASKTKAHPRRPSRSKRLYLRDGSFFGLTSRLCASSLSETMPKRRNRRVVLCQSGHRVNQKLPDKTPAFRNRSRGLKSIRY